VEAMQMWNQLRNQRHTLGLAVESKLDIENGFEQSGMILLDWRELAIQNRQRGNGIAVRSGGRRVG
jgi:hypothetical protein